MSYPEYVKKMLEKIGQDVVIHKNGTTETCKAVVMPLLYRNKLYVENQPSTVGEIDEGCYRFIGPFDACFSPDDILSFSGKRFVAQRFETIMLANEPFYSWAILRPAIEG